MKLLRLANTLNASSAPYNQFSLGLKNEIDQTFCSVFQNAVIPDKKVNCIHAEGSIFKFYLLLKIQIEEQDFDVVHIHSGLTGILFFLAIFPFKISMMKKTVFTLHNSWYVLKTRNQFLNLIVMILSKRVCTCGKSSFQSVPRFIKFVVGKKMIPIVNGFDNQRIDEIEKIGAEKEYFHDTTKLKILCIGALNNTKNQIALLQALKGLDIEGEVIFLGDGANKQNLLNYAKSIFSSFRISFKGLVPRNIAIEHMLEADVCISLSTGEGLPIAILESMYAGCYMILSDIPPHKEISPPKERCSYVNLNNQKDLINSLLYVMDEIDSIRKNRSLSKEHSISKFSVKNMLRDYVNIYSTALEENVTNN
tara:strand:- start:4529 stop:5623 length:1095 start_codon:yes stop_codon:yes gene_type:complete